MYLNPGIRVQNWFWRTSSGAEVDYIEEAGAGQIQAYEFKYRGSSAKRGADAFRRAYAVDVQPVNQVNYLDFLLNP
jgi:hypothetical protein